MNRSRYPAQWAEFSRQIRFERAGGRCECTGECGKVHLQEGYSPPPFRCHKIHLRVYEDVACILTVAHMNAKGGVCACDPRCPSTSALFAKAVTCGTTTSATCSTRAIRETGNAASCGCR